MKNEAKIRYEIKKLNDELNYLREESNDLHMIKQNGHVFDALLFYIGQPHLNEAEREGIRRCMEVIAQGGGV